MNMELSNTEIKIAVKNMAREMVKKAMAKNAITGMFYRKKNGNAQIFHDSGEAATRIDANVYPIGSSLSARYEHPEGIVLSISDAKKLGIPEE